MILKICGITRLTDARHALEHGATALGFVFWPRSPRFVAFEQAEAIISELPSFVTTVGVFVNEPVEAIRGVVAATGISAVQLHGDESPSFAAALGVPVIRSITLNVADDARRVWPSDTTFLLDAADEVRRGGTGRTVDWARARHVADQQRVILAGGLTPENVAAAVAAARPFGVDVSSGVEELPGVKDPDKVTRFLANARRALTTNLRSVVEQQ